MTSALYVHAPTGSASYNAPMAAVRLRFLGCGDAFCSGGRFHTCFLIEGGEAPMLIDCGATSLLALKREGVDPGGIGWVALSHLHGDHFGGLPWLILDGMVSGRSRPLVVGGPVGTEKRLQQAFEALYPGAGSAARPFETSFVEWAGGQAADFGPAVVTPFEVIHPGGAPPYALRVQYGGRVISYSGDTEWTDNLIGAAQDADLFVCECNDFDRQVPGHLTYRTLSEKRAALGCRRLVLTHLGADMVARVGELGLEAARDGAAVTV
jgi:ribonuclease BN (tRNA processing enzyme)